MVKRTIVGTLSGKFSLCKNLLNNRRVWGSFWFFCRHQTHMRDVLVRCQGWLKRSKQSPKRLFSSRSLNVAQKRRQQWSSFPLYINKKNGTESGSKCGTLSFIMVFVHHFFTFHSARRYLGSAGRAYPETALTYLQAVSGNTWSERNTRS